MLGTDNSVAVLRLLVICVPCEPLYLHFLCGKTASAPLELQYGSCIIDNV